VNIDQEEIDVVQGGQQRDAIVMQPCRYQQEPEVSDAAFGECTDVNIIGFHIES
jgi:hypothetical protein